MAAVKIYNLEQGRQAPDLARRGHHVIYRMQETNRCPGCGRAQWHVGRLTAECAFCGTAIALAEARWGEGGPAAPPPAAKATAKGAEHRRHKRVPVADRTLNLLIDGTPHAFAIHNLSPGGLMGDAPAAVEVGASVHVRFEGGIIVPATVKWCEDDRIGLAFESPVIFDATS